MTGKVESRDNPDIFSGDLIWDKKLTQSKGKPQPSMDFVLNRIAQEVNQWHQMEDFSFPDLPQPNYLEDAIRNVPAIIKMLSNLDNFLEETEKSEKTRLHGLFSAAVYDQDIQLRYMWAVLGDREPKTFLEAFLSEELVVLQIKYQSSQVNLRNSLKDKLSMLQSWAGAYCNGEFWEALETLYDEVVDVRGHFENWIAVIKVEEIRRGYRSSKKRILPISALHLALLNWKKATGEYVPDSDETEEIRPKRIKNPDSGPEMTSNCEGHFFHFSPGKDLRDPRFLMLDTASSGQNRQMTGEQGSNFLTSVSSSPVSNSSWSPGPCPTGYHPNLNSHVQSGTSSSGSYGSESSLAYEDQPHDKYACPHNLYIPNFGSPANYSSEEELTVNVQPKSHRMSIEGQGQFLNSRNWDHLECPFPLSEAQGFQNCYLARNMTGLSRMNPGRE